MEKMLKKKTEFYRALLNLKKDQSKSPNGRVKVNFAGSAIRALDVLSTLPEIAAKGKDKIKNPVPTTMLASPIGRAKRISPAIAGAESEVSAKAGTETRRKHIVIIKASVFLMRTSFLVKLLKF